MIRPDAEYMAQSQDRLKKIIAKKQQTTMIGSLDRIERFLGFLWGNDKFKEDVQALDNDFGLDVYTIIEEINNNLNLTKRTDKDNQDLVIRFKLLWQVLRSSILNLGNDNKRDCEKEISMYDVSWKKYTVKMPVRRDK